jgi:hypothetical protein
MQEAREKTGHIEFLWIVAQSLSLRSNVYNIL